MILDVYSVCSLLEKYGPDKVLRMNIEYRHKKQIKKCLNEYMTLTNAKEIGLAWEVEDNKISVFWYFF